jgi:hypothetical protein
MALPWVRLDANVGSHDKVLGLISDPSPKRWQALSSYFIALAWSGGQGTDGLVPKAALPFVHATPATARLLVAHRLWREEGVTGWRIVNYGERQLLTEYAEAIREKRRHGGEKGNCVRWHRPDCWKDGKCRGLSKGPRAVDE